MTVHFEPYRDPANGGRWTIDADPDDELNYVANVRQWCVDNAASVASFEIIPQGVTVMKKGIAQGEFNSLLPAKFKVNYDEGNETYATFRSTTDDDQQFDKTIWFKKVEN